MELLFTSRFPGSRPTVRFMTPIWHPNIEADGSYVCVDMGDNVRSVSCVLSALQMLLAHPNPGSPHNSACAQQMKEDQQAYEADARAMTQQYAMS